MAKHTHTQKFEENILARICNFVLLRTSFFVKSFRLWCTMRSWVRAGAQVKATGSGSSVSEQEGGRGGFA